MFRTISRMISRAVEWEGEAGIWPLSILAAHRGWGFGIRINGCGGSPIRISSTDCEAKLVFHGKDVDSGGRGRGYAAPVIYGRACGGVGGLASCGGGSRRTDLFEAR